MDGLARELGQGWVCPQIAQFEGMDLLNPRQAADFCQVRPSTLPQWRRRGLVAIGTPDGTRYRVTDLLDYQAKQRLKRLRGKRSPGSS
jgi:hypothetical protein